MPPPNTRSSSSTPISTRGGVSTSEFRAMNSVFGPRLVGVFSAFSAPGGALLASSTSVFHSPHASQRPAHLACTAPQAWQTKAEVEALAMPER